MGFDLLRRVRWGNVAFAVAALVAAISIVNAALDPAAPPRLPSDRAAPLIAGDARPRMATKPPAQAKAPAKHRAQRRTTRRPKRPHPTPVKRVVARRPPARQAPRATPVAPTVTPPAPAPAPRAPVAAAPPDRGEFGFEGG